MNGLQSNDPFIPEKYKTRNKFHYLEIPLKAYFVAFQKSRFEVFVTAAFIAGYLIAHDYSTFYQFPDRLERKELNPNLKFQNINFSYLASTGVAYKMGDRFNLQIEPIYRKSINSIIDAPIKGKLWSVGLNVGVYLKL